MICQNCGKNYDTKENTFCPQCGAGKEERDEMPNQNKEPMEEKCKHEFQENSSFCLKCQNVILSHNPFENTIENKQQGKCYILKKDCPKIGKEVGDYYNGEFAESIDELVEKGVIEKEITEE